MFGRTKNENGTRVGFTLVFYIIKNFLSHRQEILV